MLLPLIVSALLVLSQSLPAQTVHQFSGIKVLPDRTVSLTLTGSVPTPELFGQYFQQYVIEASTNLVDWFPLVTLQQTNQPTTALTFHDKAAAQSERRFYRTYTNHFITQLPQPTGPYAVGTFSRLLTDPSRMDAERGTKRQFMVTFWYPAIPQAGSLPSGYVDLAVAQNVARYGRFVDRMAEFFSHSLPDAQMARNQAKYPVVLYTHGWNLHRKDNTDKTEELASQGYIVVGLDHRDTPLSVLSDGEVIRGTGQNVSGSDPKFPDFARMTIQDRVLDARFVLDELARLSESDPMLGGRLDLEHVGVFGHMIGGSTAAELGRVEARCRAAVNIDGAFFVPDVLQEGLSKPLMILRDGTPDPEPGIQAFDDRKRVYERLERDAYWVKVANTVSASFGEPGMVWDPWTMQQTGGAPSPEAQTSGVRVSQITRAYIVSFFNKHLKNQDDHVLDGPSADYPEVMEFLKK